MKKTLHYNELDTEDVILRPVNNLPAWLFKKCSVELADVVANLINLSFHTGKVYSN